MQARADWWTDEAAGIGGIAPERLVFIDESAVLTSMARRYPVFPDSRFFRGSAHYISMSWRTKSALHQVARVTAAAVILGGGWGGSWSLSCWISSRRSGSGWV